MPYAESLVYMMEILVICILHSVQLIIVNIQPSVFCSVILLAALIVDFERLFFYVLLTVHLSIFILVINQLDEQNFGFQ